MNRLFIGSRRYSSWSMRGWLAVRLAGLDLEEILIPLKGGNTPGVKQASPSGLVPYLEHNGHRIWESLAILEYCAEISPKIWPRDSIARAHARAISAEMHGGFRDLRIGMPMQIGAHHPGQGRTAETQPNIARIDQIWSECLANSGGPFLFGDFGGADAMFAPVVMRFVTYTPELSAISQSYVAKVTSHPLVADWVRSAVGEPEDWRLPRYEVFAPTV